VLALAAALGAVLFAAAPAQAHARVVRTSPSVGATIDGRITVVRVVFGDPVRLVPRSLVVSGATGAPEPIGAPRLVGDRTLEASVPGHLPAGRYFVGWRILSDDGHVESGSFGFAVAAPGAAPQAAPVPGSSTPGMPAEPTWPLVVAAVMAGLAVLGGALVVVRGLAAVHAASAAEHAPMHH
jgi:methionine-rich copper-binding protein CopC